jgi:hypothetical protein
VASNEAQKDLLDKIRLERIVSPEIISLFTRMIRDYRGNILATGFPGDASGYVTDWTALFRKHYTRTQRVFSGDVIAENMEILSEFTDEIEALRDLELRSFTQSESRGQAEIVTRTNNKQMINALIAARLVLSEAGEPLTPRNISIQASRNLTRLYRPRVQSIATSETQKAAENTKNTEAKSSRRVSRAEWEKLWETIGDNKVRDPHVAANRQRQKGEVPFNVGGEKLLYPVDTSLGASAFNIINCRCSVRHELRR